MEKLEKKEEVRPRDWKLVAYGAGVVLLVIVEALLGKAGWFVLPVVVLLGTLAQRRIQKIKTEPATVLRLKSVKPRRDSYR